MIQNRAEIKQTFGAVACLSIETTWSQAVLSIPITRAHVCVRKICSVPTVPFVPAGLFITFFVEGSSHLVDI